MSSRLRFVSYAVIAVVLSGLRPCFPAWRELLPVNGGAVNQIAFDTGGVLYAIGSSGLFRSTDKGGHWIAIGTSLPSQTFTCLATYGAGTIYVCGGQGFYKSSNQGLTWQTLFDNTTHIPSTAPLPFNTAIYQIAVASVNGEPWVYLGSWGNYILRSKNGGQDWEQLSSGLQIAPNAPFITSIAIDPSNPRRIYTSTWRGRLFRSDNGGDTFQQMSDSGLWANGQIYVAPKSTNILYTFHDELNFGRGTVLRSTDYGDHWTGIGRPANGAPSGVVQLALDPDDSNTVYAATSAGIAKTSDAANWSMIYELGQVSPFLRSMVAVAVEPPVSAGLPRRVYAGSSYYGFARLLDPSIGWTVANNGLTAASVTDITVCCSPAAASSTIYASVQGMGYLKSVDGGPFVALAAQVQGTSDRLGNHALSGLSVHPSDPSVLIAATNSGLDSAGSNMWRSTDGAITFKQVAATYASPFIRFNPRDPTRVSASLQDWQGAFFLSTDTGASWSVPAYTYIYPGDFVYHPSRANVIFNRGDEYTGAPLTTNYVMWSNDGGVIWNRSFAQGTGYFGYVALDLSDTNILYVSGSLSAERTQGIYRFRVNYDTSGAVTGVTRDQGVFNTGLTDTSVRRLLYDPTHSTLYASTSSGVFRSTDKAVTWTALPAGLPYLSTDVMALTPDGNTLLVGTNGGIWAYTDTSSTPARLEVSLAGDPSATPLQQVNVGDYPAGAVSAKVVPVILANRGGSAARIAAPVLQPSGTPFSATSHCPSSLASGAQCQIDIEFQPAAKRTGASTAVCVIASDASNPTINLALLGNATGIPAAIITLSKSKLSFPDQVDGSTSAVLTVDLMNGGNAAAIITPTLRQGSASTFTMTHTCGTLGPGGRCTVAATFQSPEPAVNSTCPISVSSGVTPSVGVIDIGGAPSPLSIDLIGNTLKDTDGDGLPDLWEVQGLKNAQGAVVVDLPAMGADPCRKDVFVQVNWMRSSAHDHALKAAAAMRVIAAFDQAPDPDPANPQPSKRYLNPIDTRTGLAARGIHLYIDCGPGCVVGSSKVPNSGVLPHFDPITGSVNELGFQNGLQYSWSSFDVLKTIAMPPERWVVFHFIAMAHGLGGSGLQASSGISRTGGSDAIVSLGAYDGYVGDAMQQAGTLMHELGHSLGLHHGGYDWQKNNWDDTDSKPNYLSVMNYLFQTRGLVDSDLKSGILDYSRVKTPPLLENALNELIGIAVPPVDPLLASFGTRHLCQGFDAGPTRIAPIDWDCIPNMSATAVDVNGDGQVGTLKAADSDWRHLVFTGGSIGQLGAPPPPPSAPVVELTKTQDDKIKTIQGVVAIAPGDTSLPFGGSAVLQFTVRNKGNIADVFALSYSTTRSWIELKSLPAQLSLAPGASAVISIPVRAPASLAAEQATAEVGLIATSSANTNVLDTARAFVTAGSANLAISATGMPASLLAGNKVTYTLTIRNNGPDSAPDATVIDTLPPGVTFVSGSSTAGSCAGQSVVQCSLGALDAGAQAVVTITVIANTAGVVANTVSVSSSIFDPAPGDNSTSVVNTVVGKPALSVRVGSSSTSGTTLTVTLVFTNTGSGAARNIVVTRMDPRVLAGSGSLTYVQPSLPFGVPDLAPGQTGSVPATLTVSATITRLSITETGSMQDLMGNTYSFAPAQAITR